MPPSPQPVPPRIHLRPVTPADLPTLFQQQLDPEGNRMAAVKPRDAAAYEAVWARVFADPAVVPRAIILDDPAASRPESPPEGPSEGKLVGSAAFSAVNPGSRPEGTLVGSISCFQRDGLNYVGYWIDCGYWGRGIAGRALALLLEEVTIRPLHARVATNNGASLRVLERCGFTIRERRFSPETDRFLACEEAILTLD